MIYVHVEGIKGGERGSTGGNFWVDTSNVDEAISEGLRRFHLIWDAGSYLPPVTYNITVAGEISPCRTCNDKPLPVRREAPCP